MSIIVKNGKFERPISKILPGVRLSSAGDHNANYKIGAKEQVIRPDEGGGAALRNLENISFNVPSIRIIFKSSTDGRGFSIAKWLRQMGYQGHLRASGHVLADQYPLALRCGFDDVEISNELAARQPECQWLDAYKRAGNTYQNRLMAPPAIGAIAA